MVNGKWLAVIFSFAFLCIFLHRYALSQQRQQQARDTSHLLNRLQQHQHATASTTATQTNCRIAAEKSF